MQVQIGPIAYRIVISKKAMSRLNRASASNNLGEVRHPVQEMVIDSDQGPDRLAETLMHEVLHGILRVYSLEDRPADEAFVRLLSPILLDTLRRNREVTSFLLETSCVTARVRSGTEGGAVPRIEEVPP